jgi:predicted pyridoxine 5'-phosphate oxidase superfamily flavin-nucleotide-binding protein
MYRIDDKLKEFIEAGPATIIGTGDAGGRPHVAYGWAPRVTDTSTVEVFLDTARAERTLSNLSDNKRIAVTFADPVSVRSVQLKGTFERRFEPNDADQTWVRQAREAFVVSTSLIGDPPTVIRNLWLDDVIGIVVNVESAFDQTPGPDAGRPL